MSREELILRPDSVRVEGDDLVVDVRLPWYRSLPLSAVLDIDIVVDGVPVPADALVLEIAGARYRLADLAARYDVVWFIQDPARVHVPRGAITAGETHQVGAGVRLRLPYIILEGSGPLERYNRMDRTLVVGASVGEERAR